MKKILGVVLASTAIWSQNTYSNEISVEAQDNITTTYEQSENIITAEKKSDNKPEKYDDFKKFLEQKIPSFAEEVWENSETLNDGRTDYQKMKDAFLQME